MLACFFGVEWFHTIYFGHAFIVKSDHKPLEQIKLKNLADAPVCFTENVASPANYDVHIKYHPGKEMLVIDDASFIFYLIDLTIILSSRVL